MTWPRGLVNRTGSRRAGAQSSVPRQLGHASITPTADTYGKWLPMADRGAVDAIDDPTWKASGSKVVANGDVTYSDGRRAPTRRRKTAVRVATYEVGRVGLEPATRCLKEAAGQLPRPAMTSYPGDRGDDGGRSLQRVVFFFA